MKISQEATEVDPPSPPAWSVQMASAICCTGIHLLPVRSVKSRQFLYQAMWFVSSDDKSSFRSFLVVCSWWVSLLPLTWRAQKSQDLLAWMAGAGVGVMVGVGGGAKQTGPCTTADFTVKRRSRKNKQKTQYCKLTPGFTTSCPPTPPPKKKRNQGQKDPLWAKGICRRNKK